MFVLGNVFAGKSMCVWYVWDVRLIQVSCDSIGNRFNSVYSRKLTGYLFTDVTVNRSVDRLFYYSCARSGWHWNIVNVSIYEFLRPLTFHLYVSKLPTVARFFSCWFSKLKSITRSFSMINLDVGLTFQIYRAFIINILNDSLVLLFINVASCSMFFGTKPLQFLSE